jgi:hypothetical protein
MTADQPSRGSSGTIILPLRAARGRYSDVGEGYTPSGSPQSTAVLRTLLEHSCTVRDGQIAEIAGRLYRTRLLVPRGDPDVAYAEIDQKSVPIDVLEAPPIPAVYPAYADYLRQECRFSDYLSHDTCVSLKHAFIPPRFRLVDSVGEKEVSWQELRDYPRFLIVGPPGAGKTSCLRRLVLDLLSPAPQVPTSRPGPHDTLPILIKARDFPAEDFGLTTISRLVNAEYMVDLLSEFRPPLEGRRLLLAIDGLDELASSEQEVFLARLDSLCQEVPLIRAILTTRDPIPSNGPSDFVHFRLLPFDTAQVQQWARVYLASHNPQQSRWSEFTDMIRYDSQLRDLTSNPLLLGIASSLHWKYPDELNNLTGLLGKCIEALVQDWDAGRGIARWRNSEVTPRQIRQLLNRLSFLLLKERRTKFTLHDVDVTISDMTGFRESAVILLSACQTSGLVQDSGEDQYVFSHLALADYFAASDMVSRTSNVTEDIRDLSAEEDGRFFWRLTCALASNADQLLIAAYEHGQADERPGDERAAAFMLAQALGEEISASSDVIDRCSDLVVTAIERRLRGVQPLDQPTSVTRWRSRDERPLLWVVAATADRDEQTHAELVTCARLLELIYRARTGTAGAALCSRLQQSEVPLVRQAAGALVHAGWCEHVVVPESNKTVFCIAVTQSSDVKKSYRPGTQSALKGPTQRLEPAPRRSGALGISDMSI